MPGTASRGQTLKHRVVLAVDGQQRGARGPHGLHEQRPRHDQRFLVGQQQTFSRACSRERRTQPGRSDDGRHDAVDFGQRRDLVQCVDTRQHAGRRAARAQYLFQPGRGGYIGKRRVRRRETQRLLGEFLGIAMGTERDHAEAVRVASDHVERGLAHRSGGPQDGDADHAPSFME